MSSWNAQSHIDLVEENSTETICLVSPEVVINCSIIFIFKALTKFLKCVDWSQPQEARQVCQFTLAQKNKIVVLIDLIDPGPRHL